MIFVQNYKFFFKYENKTPKKTTFCKISYLMLIHFVFYE